MFVTRQGVRRTEFNFAGEQLLSWQGRRPGKIEFCTPDPSQRGRWAYAAICLLLVLTAAAAAQDQQAPDNRLVARVDEEPISAREVERELARATNERPLQPEAKRVLRAETIRQLVNRRLVFTYLAQHGLGASPQDLTQALNRIRKQLEKQQQTLADYLEQAGLSETELKRNLAWQMSWQRCLERHLTDENLERYFNQHRRDFDGTTLRVAQILFQVEPRRDSAALAKAIARAEQVREELRSGKLAFAAAARRDSAAPSGKQGGDLGEISRHEPMPEPFSQAAFALEKDGISPPVVTPFGVHLITCQEIKPGQKTWSDVRGELEQAVTQYLFQWMADRQRPKSKVELLETSEPAK